MSFYHSNKDEGRCIGRTIDFLHGRDNLRRISISWHFGECGYELALFLFWIRIYSSITPFHRTKIYTFKLWSWAVTFDCINYLKYYQRHCNILDAQEVN